MKYCNYTPSLIKNRRLLIRAILSNIAEWTTFAECHTRGYKTILLLFYHSASPAYERNFIVCREREIDYRRLTGMIVHLTYVQRGWVEAAVSPWCCLELPASHAACFLLLQQSTQRYDHARNNNYNGKRNRWICPQNLKCDFPHFFPHFLQSVRNLIILKSNDDD